MALVVAYLDIYVCIYTKKKVAFNMHNLAFSEVSDGPYCDNIVTTRNKTYAANLIAL